jgi:glycosyltransferase involved in cell wall biosynthesis
MSAAADSRPSLAMLMSHDPVLDPRIGWEASSASAKFDVLAIGLQPPWSGGAAQEEIDGYRVRRLVIRPSMGATAGFVLNWLRVLRWRERLAVLALLAAGGWLLALIPLVAHGLLWVGARFAPVKRAARAAWARCTFLHPVYDFLHEEINWRFAPATRMLWREFTDGGLRPAVVHCNDLDTLLVGALAKRAYGCRLVYDAHEFWPYGRPGAGWYYSTFYRFYERSLIHQCDAVVTVNPLLAGAMAAEYGLSGVLSVPNAEPWRGQTAARSGELTSLAGDRVKFLFQGGFSGERGIEEMIRAWRLVDGTRAALFLRGPRNPRRDACEALARELGLLGRSVFVLEPVAEHELVAASMEADVGVIPYKPTLINHKYCCPNKLSQFLQAGLMVLTNDLPYVKQVIAAAGAGLSFDTRDETTVVEAVRRATDDAALRARCGESGRAYARRAFNWQQFYPVLEAAYLGRAAPRGVEEVSSCAG